MENKVNSQMEVNRVSTIIERVNNVSSNIHTELLTPYAKVMIPATFDATKYPNKVLADKAKLVFDMAYSFAKEKKSNTIQLSVEYINNRIGKTGIDKDGKKLSNKRWAWNSIKPIMLTQGLKEGSLYKSTNDGKEVEVAYLIKQGKSKQYEIDYNSFVESTVDSYYGNDRASKNDGKQYHKEIGTGFIIKKGRGAGKEVKENLQLDLSDKSIKQALINPYVFSYHCLYDTNLTEELKKGYIRDSKDIPFTSVRGNICKYGRLHTPLTNLWKKDRPNIKWNDGSNINWIDIKNSQPLMLCILMNEEGIIDSEYTKDIESGLLYEKFYDLVKEVEDIRKEVKQEVFKHIYFGEIKTNVFSDRFKLLYPTAFNFLCELKKFDYCNSSHKCQLKESDIVFNEIGSVLLSKGIKFLTIHDSFGVYEKDIKYVSQLIKDTFSNNYGVSVKITVN